MLLYIQYTGIIIGPRRFRDLGPDKVQTSLLSCRDYIIEKFWFVILLSKKRITNALIRLCDCVGLYFNEACMGGGGVTKYPISLEVNRQISLIN